MSKAQRVLELALVFAAFFLPGYLGQASLGTGAGTDLTSLMAHSLLTGIPQLLLMIYIVSLQPDWSPGRWGILRLRAGDAARIVACTAGCLGLGILLVSLPPLLPARWSPLLVRGFRWSLARPSQLPLAILFGITAGYREEFFFRSYLMGRLGEAGMPGWAIIALSTALFAAGHLYEGVLGIVTTAGIGLIFALVYLRTRNLHVVALSHGLYNTLSLAMSLLSSGARGPTAG